MKQIINYSGLSGTEKEEKALQDCKDYLGEKGFALVVKAFADFKKPMPMQAALFNLSFAGIEGYPALVFAKKYAKLLPEQED